MKKQWVMAGCMLAAAVTVRAEPLRAIVLDFEEQTGVRADAALGGAVDTKALSQKGVFVMAQQLASQTNFSLIDRRDFLSQLQRAAPDEKSRPSFLRAAQALNADVVIRGILQGVSVGKTAVKQGGYAAEFSTLTVRVGLEALDTVDGAVIAASGGRAQEKVRQTENLQTILGDEEMYALLEKAVAEALPKLERAVCQRAEQQKARPLVKINISASANPALVEVDGLLVGTTPIEGLEVTKGDHVLTIGKAGYRDISKRIVFDRDMKIEVPMIRTELSADEIKDVLDKARVNMIIGEPGLTILPLAP